MYEREANSLMNIWQPIETYPLPANDFDYSEPEILVYSPTRGIKLAQCIREDDFCGDDDSVSYFFRHDNGFLTTEHITHWMPLPEPPRISVDTKR